MLRQRAGIAIIAALGGIVVIGALIAGVFFVSTQESEISGGALVQERAFRAAELGLNKTLARWDSPVMFALPVGGMVTMADSGTGWVDTVVVTKITNQAYSILSTATAGSGRFARSRKKTLLSVRLSSPDFDFLGALTVRGEIVIGGSSLINGRNTNPAGWGDCPAANDTLAGVAIADSTQISYSGCPSGGCVTGSPRILQDPTASDTANYFTFGDEDWTTLTAAADKIVTGTTTFSQINPVVSNGACDKSAAANWGAPVHTIPANPCENYFPIIYSKGSTSTLKLSGNRGQGILLVDGDLEISGGFEFYGPVIVRGRIKTTGTGGKLNGGVMTANIQLDQNTVLGDATINYSRCAVEKAIAASAKPRRLVQRAWTEVH
ncbi:MAG: hypothetical protein ACSLFE_00915 [Gemmatimonadaceae bacterium]